ncbi:hypothetical protein FOA52_007017 [Chlamydomonas sp. UWO 241]|nr:hypothetical protein FOA52_007017 [Chlamydomonas sp. UWO 241]
MGGPPGWYAASSANAIAGQEVVEVSAAAAIGEENTCHPTPNAAMGPFYSAGAPFLKYWCRRDKSVAPTPKLTIMGKVYDASTCSPATRLNGTALNAVVEVWQADNNGEYDNVAYNCRSSVPVLPSGTWGFNSIMPARYGDLPCLRPAHVHLRVTAAGYATLVTQLYFAGDPYLGDADCGCGSACRSGDALLWSNLTCSGQRKIRCRGRFDIRLVPL